MRVRGFFGVDASQKSLMIAEHGRSATQEIGNSTRAISAWLKALEGPCAIAVESTGRHHRLLATLAIAAGHTVYVVNPRDIKHYGKALGRRAKTDRVDALLIARYLAQEHDSLRAWVLPSKTQELLSSALARRGVLVGVREQIRASCEAHEAQLTQLGATLEQLARLIEEVDEQLEQLSAADPVIEAIKRRLLGIPGIGPVVSTALANLLSRYQFRNADALIAYVGLDPRANDSGQHRGRRKLSKRGPAELRRLVFNAAMSGARTAAWRGYYRCYRERGLSGTASFVILGRKMLRAVFSMVRHNTEFDPIRVQGACAKP